MAGYDHNDLGEWLPQLLIEKGLTVERFAYSVGVTKGTIYKYMNDVFRPPYDRIEKMCEVLGVPVEEGLKQYSPPEDSRERTRRGLSRRNR